MSHLLVLWLSILLATALSPQEALAGAECDSLWNRLRLRGGDVPKEERVHVVLDLGVLDDIDDDESYTMVRYREAFRKAYPGEAVVYIRPRSADELKRRVDEISAKGVKIRSLVVHSHGMRGLVSLQKSDVKGDALELWDFETLNRIFQSVKYTPDVNIVFIGCNVIEKEPDRMIRALADAMHVHRGRVYANEEIGLIQPHLKQSLDRSVIAPSLLLATERLLLTWLQRPERLMTSSRRYDPEVNGGKAIVRDGETECIEDANLLTDFLEDKLFENASSPYRHLTQEEVRELESARTSDSDASKAVDDPEHWLDEEELEGDGSYSDDINSDAAY